MNATKFVTLTAFILFGTAVQAQSGVEQQRRDEKAFVDCLSKSNPNLQTYCPIPLPPSRQEILQLTSFISTTEQLYKTDATALDNTNKVHDGALQNPLNKKPASTVPASVVSTVTPASKIEAPKQTP